MDKTYFTVSMDMAEVDEQIRKVLELRNEMIMAVEQLGHVVNDALLQLETAKAPGCSGNCKRGDAESANAAESNTYNLVVENGETIDVDSLARRVADANLL